MDEQEQKRLDRNPIYKQLKREKAGLIDIAPTILKLLNLKKPSEMTGKSLV